MFIAPLGFFAGESENFPAVTNALPNNSSDSGWIDMTDNAILWHFDETTGNFTDSSGNNRTGTKYSLTQGNPGIHGKLVNFPGNGSGTAGHQENSYNRVDASYGVTSGSTIMMWVKGTEGTLWTIADGDLQFPLSLDFDSSSTILKFGYHGNVTLNTHLGDNEWHHLAIYLGASETKIYVDGSLDVSSTSKTWGGWNTALSGIGYWETPTIFTLGCYRVKNLSGSDCSDPFSGKVDEFAIFERELGLWEINNAYRGYKYNSVPPTIAVSQTNNGTNQATITVTITDPDSVVTGWAWKTSAFGSVGTAHGGTVGTGTTATITGLSQSLHTIHVVLFDGNGNIVAGLDGSAATVNVNVDLSDFQTLVRTDLNRYYHFNGDLNDYSGNGNHASMGAGTATYGTDKWNQQAFVPKDNAIVNSGHPMISTDTTYSIAAWVYSDTNKTSATICLNSVHYSTWGPGGIYVNFGGTTANATGFYYRYSNSNVTPYSCAIPALATGQWHHIVAVQNGSTMQVWVNGTKETEITNATNAPFATSNPMYIGGYKSNQSGAGGYGGEATDVKIDEFAYWTKSLTQGEIEYLWNSGAGRHIYDADSTVDASVSVSGDTVNISVTIGDPGNNATGGWAYSTSPLGAVGAAHGGTAVSSGTTAQITGVSDGSYTLYYGLIDSSGNVVVKGSTAYGVGLTVGLILQHDCDDATADVGTSNATLTSVTSGAISGRDAWSFSSTSSRVVLDSNKPSFTANSSWTLSMWFYNLKPTGNWRTAARSASSPDIPIILENNSTNLGAYKNGTGFYDSGFDMAHTDYTGWNHIAAVGEGTSIKYYVNGSLVGTAATNHAWDLTSIGNLHQSSYNQVFADAIGDLRVWNRSLGASDINALYTSSLVLSDGRAAQYTLDFNSDDGIGSNDLTETGTWTYPQNGNYRSADTTSGYLGTTSTVNVDQGTISLWAKHDGGHTYNSNDYKGLVIGGANPNSKLSFGLLNNKIRLQYYNGSSWSDTRDTLAISAGTWNHYTIAFDLASNEIKVYLNGSLRLTYSSFTQSMGSMTLYYGISSSSMASAWYLNGELDDIQTWNRSLSASEVTSLNSAGRTTSISLTTGLTHRWSFDTDGAPAVGAGTLTSSNGVTHVTANGRTYASFPNRNSSYWINSPYIDLPNTYTMSFWFKDMYSRSGAQGNFLMATSNHGGSNGGSSGTVGYDITVYHNDELGAWGPATSGASHSQRTTGFSMVSTDYQGWHHMAMVMENGTATYYVDGVKAGNSVTYYGQQKIQIIGSLAGYNYGLAAAYDDFRLWNRALAASEILELKETTHVIEDDFVAHYELDGNANDSVGSNNGTVSGATFATVSGKQHASFDGSGDTINFGDANEFEINANDSRTFSGWFNFDSSMTGITTILTKRSASGTNKGYVLWRHSNGNVYFQLTNGSTIAAVDSQTSVSLSAWHHIAITIDRANSEMKMYVDGVLKDTENISSVPDLSSTNAFIMGWGDNIDDYHGLIDDYRVWTRSLSASEVSSLNSTGRPGVAAIQVNGYYPLYTTAGGAQGHSGGNGTYHTHVFGGVTYYMPNGLTLGTTQFHGTYGQVAGYNFDSANANDTIGSNNGTVTGATFATTGGRTVIEYDGSGDYVTIPYNSALQPQTAITVATWIKFDSAGNWYDFPVYQAGTGTSNEYAYSMWRYRNDGVVTDHGKLAWRLRTDNGHAQCLTSFIPNTNQWYHLVGTYDGSQMKLYVDGSLHTTTSQTGNIKQYANQPLYLNKQLRYPESGTTVSGKINGSQDDVRIYSRAIPASEVQYIYESTIPLTEGMVAKYALDSDANDSVGSNNLIANGTVAFTDGAADFNSTGGYLESTSTIDLTGAFTLSFWTKIDSAQTVSGNSYSAMFTYGSSAGSYIAFYALNNKLRINHNPAGQGNTDNRYTTSIPSGWNHVALVMDPATNTQKVYLNGSEEALDSSYNTAFTGAYDAAQKIKFGHNFGNTSYNPDNHIDDVRLWNRALSATEASSLNSAGRETTAFDVYGYYPLYYTATDANAASEGNGSSHSHVLGGVTYYMPNGIAGGVGGGNQFHGTYGQVLGADFDSANANDTIGSNNGSATGVTFATESGRSLASFDASSGEVINFGNVSDLEFGTGDFSLACWVNFNSISSGTYVSAVMAKGFTSQTSPKYNGFILDAYNGNLQFKVGGGGGYSLLQQAISTGQWYHVVATRSGTSTKLYVNGSLAQSNTDSTTRDVNPSTTLPFVIGAMKNVTAWYTGVLDAKIDDIRVYNRELPASEAQYIYESTIQLTDGMVSKYALDYDANDSVGTNNGTVTGATFAATGNKRQAAFDGTNDYIEIPHDASMDFGADFTISTWINTSQTSNGMVFGKTNDTTGTNNAVNALWVNNGAANKARYVYRDTVGTLFAVASTTSVNDGAWHNIIVALEGTNLKMYVDGTLESTATGVGTGTHSTTTPMNLGVEYKPYSGGSRVNYYNGSIDDFKIWSRALSATEASSLNSAGREDSISLTDDILGTWNFDSANASDSVGSNNGTANNMTFTTSGGRTFADFNGTNGDIHLDQSVGDYWASDTTLTMWVKTTQTPSSGQFAQIHQVRESYSSSAQSYFAVTLQDTGKVDLTWRSKTGTFATQPTYSGNTINDGQWHHLAIVKSGTSLHMYVDGSLSGTLTNVQSNFASNLAVRIGSYTSGSGSSRMFDGQMDDIRMWTRALAAGEVANLHSST